MDIFLAALLGLGLVGLLWCGWVRSKRLLHLFQLDSYSPKRLLRLLANRPRVAVPTDLVAAALFGLGLTVTERPILRVVFTLVWTVYVIGSVRGSVPPPEKKPLVFTGRAKRLVILTILIFGDVVVAAAFLISPAPKSIAEALRALAFWLPIGLLLLPVWLLLANLILMPAQAILNRAYLARARRKIRELDPLVVGITGSYGKTSTKNFCEAILRRHFNVLATPKSFNTLLGVSRTINEELVRKTEIFLVEMGAYTMGEIRPSASLTRPKVGLITAIGLQHLERFGSRENIEKAKGELLEELAPDGVAILNGDEEATARLEERVPSGEVLKFSVSGQSDAFLRADRIEQNREGLRFTLVGADGTSQEIKSRLLGRHNVANMTAAAAIALHLGMKLPEIGRALETLEAPPHRLELKKGVGGSTIIDNAYSSNPVGAHGSLEVLADLDARWRILVTPGMVELGPERGKENERLGAAATEVCDHIILVGREVASEVKRGVVSRGFDSERLHEVGGVDEVGSLLETLGVDSRDLVLFENDLPDLYE
ncbi:MAG: UDP-N-acetylmuramoyl-tripeptide--D-alanyl-D-alanine ligase [Thermoanaerobaculia bacterium]